MRPLAIFVICLAVLGIIAGVGYYFYDKTPVFDIDVSGRMPKADLESCQKQLATMRYAIDSIELNSWKHNNG